MILCHSTYKICNLVQKPPPRSFLTALFPNSLFFSHLFLITDFWSVTPKVSQTSEKDVLINNSGVVHVGARVSLCVGRM